MTNPHTDFIIAAYAFTFVVIAVIVATLIADYRSQRRALSKFEAEKRDEEGEAPFERRDGTG